MYWPLFGILFLILDLFNHSDVVPEQKSIPIHIFIEVDPEAENSETRSYAACGRVLPSNTSWPEGRLVEGVGWGATELYMTRLSQHLLAFLGSLPSCSLSLGSRVHVS